MHVDRSSLARLGALRLATPGLASSLQQGDRRSRVLGRGVEFADYRPYDAGDDIRLVDWNVYQRLGTTLIKRFHEDRALSVRVYLDVSTSMGFGEPRKADHGAQLAASLAMVALANRDPTHLCTVGGPSSLRAAASNLGGLGELLEVLTRAEPGGEADLGAQIAADLGSRRADRLVLISDLLVEDDVVEALLRRLAAGSRHAVLLHVLGGEELRPDLREGATVTDAETGEELLIGDGAEAQRAYAAALDRWLGAIASRCRALGIQYAQAFTTKPAGELVLSELRRAQVVELATGTA